MYEHKIADVMKQSEVACARAESAEGHVEAIKKKFSDLQMSMQVLPLLLFPIEYAEMLMQFYGINNTYKCI